MPNYGVPAGGKYTRPRRGYRAKSHYRERLRKRGLSTSDVRMDSLDVLRKRQGYVSGPANGFDSKKRAYKSLRSAHAGLQVHGGMPEMAHNNSLEVWDESSEMEWSRY